MNFESEPYVYFDRRFRYPELCGRLRACIGMAEDKYISEHEALVQMRAILAEFDASAACAAESERRDQ